MGKSPFKKSVEIKAIYFPKNRIAIIQGERKITWRELNERVNRLASQLRRVCNVKRGDRVAFIFWNSPQFVETNLAIQAVGAIPVPVNYRYVANELAYLVNNSESDVLLFDIEVLEMVEEAHAEIPRVRHYICFAPPEKIPDGYLDYEELIETGKKKNPKVKGKITDDDIALICYTGGTTGRPKGVMLSYGAIQYNQEAFFAHLMKFLPSVRDVADPRFAKNEFQRKLLLASAVIGGSIFSFMSHPAFKEDGGKVVVFEAPTKEGVEIPSLTLAWREEKLKLMHGIPPKEDYDLLFHATLGDQIRDQKDVVPLRYSRRGRLKLLPKAIWKFIFGGIKMEGPFKLRLKMIGAQGRVSEEETSAMLCVPPLFHIAAYAAWLVQWLYTNAAVIFTASKSFDAQEILEIIEREQVRYLLLVPTQWKRLVEHPDVNKFDLSSLYVTISGGAYLSASIKKKMVNAFPNALVIDVFGQTEMAPITSVKTIGDHKDIQDRSIGQLIEGIEIKLVDDNGNEVSDGQIGEIWYRGPTLMKGYYGDEKKTREVITEDGWFKSGDLAYLGEDGQLYIIERKKACINCGAEKIYPLEVEECIIEHPAVDSVCVIGVPDEEWGETVRAVVVLKQNKTVSDEDIMEFCKGKIAGFKKPRSVVFADKLPLTPVGKVQRKRVKDLYGK